MRSEYIILWLDDEFENDSSTLNRWTKQVEKYLDERGFQAKIIRFSNEEEVTDYIAHNNKIDLFLSDYNITDDFNGLDFLVSMRKRYKQEMILYSHLEEINIKNHIVKFIQSSDVSLNFFSKFIFQSALNPTLFIKEVESIIDLTLIRWEELNALRGLVLSETSQIHEDAKEYITAHISDAKLLSNFKKNFKKPIARKNEVLEAFQKKAKKYLEILNDLSFYEVECFLCETESDFHKKWQEIRELRNGCAHISVAVNKKNENYIQLKNGQMIKESEIGIYRRKLKAFVLEYYSTFVNKTDHLIKN